MSIDSSAPPSVDSRAGSGECNSGKRGDGQTRQPQRNRRISLDLFTRKNHVKHLSEKKEVPPPLSHTGSTLTLGDFKREPLRAIRSFCRINYDGSSDGYWIHSDQANFCFGFVIFVNSIFIGIQTDLFREDGTGFQVGWFVPESCFLVIFTLELSMRVSAEGRRFVKEPWTVFDFLLVSAGVADTWVIALLIPEDASDGDGADLQFITLLRIMRLLRLARVLRILRIFRFFKELLLLAQGIMGAMKALVWAMLLTMLILYVCSIFATKLIGHADRDSGHCCDEALQAWFGTLAKSLFTLFQVLTLENWPDIARHCIDHVSPWLGLCFVVFLMLTNTVLLNLVTGVILENVLAISRREFEQQLKKEETERAQILARIKKAFDIADENQDGTVTIEEFEHAMQNQMMIEQLKSCAIAQYEAEELFVLLDVDHSGSIEVDEFIEGCMRVRGTARAKHLLGLQYDLHKVWGKLSDQVLGLGAKIEIICRHLGIDVETAVKVLQQNSGMRSSSRNSTGSLSRHTFNKLLSTSSNRSRSMDEYASFGQCGLRRPSKESLCSVVSSEDSQKEAQLTFRGLEAVVSRFLDRKLTPLFSQLRSLQKELSELGEVADDLNGEKRPREARLDQAMAGDI